MLYICIQNNEKHNESLCLKNEYNGANINSVGGVGFFFFFFLYGGVGFLVELSWEESCCFFLYYCVSLYFFLYLLNFIL